MPRRPADEPRATPRAADVYRQLAPAVRGYVVASRVRDPDDVVGEIFLQVARDLRRFRGGDDADVRRWVFTIARHRVIDARRAAARRPETLAAELPEPASGAPPPALPDPTLVDALAALTDEQREVVALRFVADLSLEQVAEITGRPVGAVKSMQHRALTALARLLETEPIAE